MKPTAGWKVVLFASGALAILFVIFGGFTSGYSLRAVIALALAGGLLGAIIAPELEPAAFPQPRIWQMVFSILGCLLIAFHVDAGPVGFAIAVVAGGLLGYFARYWTKYIDVPS